MPTITFDVHSHQNERKVKSADYWKEAAKRSIEVMAITEHADLDPEKAFLTIAKEKPAGKVLIPGMELNTSIGHVLCYSPSTAIYQEKKWQQYGLPIEEAAALAEQNDCTLSVAHPWGYQHDSAAFLIGPTKLIKLVKKFDLGIEAYNGMVGHLSDIIFESGWVKNPVKFLGFLEKNKITRNIGLGFVGKKLGTRVEGSIWNTLSRVNAGSELAEHASFVTAGSDAHTADRIGEGMLKLNAEKMPETPAEAIALLRHKQDIVWCGVGVEEEAAGIYKKIPRTKIKRWELWDGFKYATKRTMSEKVWKKIRQKKQAEKRVLH